MAEDKITVTIGGQEYAGWKEVRITRDVRNCAADFELSVSERWAGNDQPWQIKPFDPCTISLDGELLLTGYVEVYNPSFDATSHGVRIAGRSKTCDIVDCMPEIPGGEFTNYTLDKIAKAICGPFGINVVVAPGTDLGGPIPNATLEKAETGYAFLEKLCGLQGVLAFDDEKGNLVLAQAGTAGTAGALVQGENILAAGAHLTSNHRFKQYIVLSQAPLAYDEQDAQLEVVGKATDNGCPRFRRFAEMSADPADTARATLRAKWRAAHNFGEATQAGIMVQGFRQAGGDLWKINQMAPVKAPYLAIDQQLMIGAVTLMLSEEGRRTDLMLAPQEAFTTQPPKAKKPKGGGTSSLWSGNLG